MNRVFVAHLLESYFRHRWLNLIPLFLMIAGAAAWLFTSKPEYVSQGTIYVQGGTLLSSLVSDTSSQTSWASPAKATSDDLNSLLQSDSFMRAVIAHSDLEPEMNKGARAANDAIKEARRAVWTQTLGQNMVLVGAAHKSPAIAQQLSAGVIQNYIRWRVNSGNNEAASAQGYFERLIPRYVSEVQTARQDLQAYLVQHPDPARGERPTEETFQIERLQAAVQEATQRLNEAVAKAEKAKLAGDRSTIDVEQTYTVVDTPQLPPEPSTSRRKQALSAAVFLLAGLLLSGLTVAGETLLDTTLRFPSDVQQQLGLRVLGAIPHVRPPRMPRKPRPAETDRPVAEPTAAAQPAAAQPAVGSAAQNA